MKRRQFVGTTLGVATLGSTSAAANGKARGRGNGKGRGSGAGGSDLVNAEVTADGAIVATDDGFVIAGQEIVVDDRDFHDGEEGTSVVYNDGYSGTIADNEIDVQSIPNNPTFGIRIEGGNVDVTGNAVDGEDELSHQFLSVAYADGASGKVEDNTLNGGHRVGVLAEGAGTSVSIRNNDVTGLGPKSDGWAENGIQVSSGATAHVRGNTVADHWWDKDDFQSSGIILFQPGDGVHLQRNTVRDNDGGVVLWGGDGHNAIHNTVEVTEADPGESGVFHTGFWALETENSGVRQNTITAEDGDVGIVVEPTAENTKLIGNDVSGFAEPILDQGADTKLPAPFDPDA